MNFCTQLRAWATAGAVVSVSTSLILVGRVGAETMDLAPKTGLPALQYTNAPSKIPSYAAGAKWGTPGEAINQMQLPLSPAESARRVVARPGFTATLWAAEPDILKPICMAWDERGRLWIAETVDYPNELQPPGLGRDRIKICEDTDGDGKADKFTVFADKLSIPTAMCFANGGLIVFEAGHALFLKDTDGDGKADERRVLFEGWGMDDTHATANSLRYGLDNWIWGTVGYSGFKGEVGGKKLEFGMGVFRFKPDGSVLEFIKSSNNNTWGLGLSEEGIVFGSTANNNASWYMPIPNRYYEAVSGWGASRMETMADSQAYYPIAKHIRQVDAHGKYTAGAGHALYTARSFPKDYWNKVAFVTEPTGHLIGQFRLEAKGAGFGAHNEHNFLASDDEWFAPIAADVGPDGAVWMLDWYNYIIQHNPTPAGFENGKGNAYVTPLRDKRHGRIYRVTWNEGKPSAKPDLQSKDAKQWVKALASDNQLWRMHAQRLLVERGQMDVVPALQAMVKDTTVDEVGLNVGAMHALWTIHGLMAKNTADETLMKTAEGAIHHASAGVRRAGLMALPRTEKAAAELVRSGVLRDADPQVRLAAFLAMAEMPVSVVSGGAVFNALLEAKYFQRAEEVGNAEDRWIPDAATAAGARHAEGFLRMAAWWSFPVHESVQKAARVVAAHAAQHSEPEVLAGLLFKLNESSPLATPLATPIIDGLASGSTAEHSPKMGEEQKAKLVALMKALPVAGRSSLLDLGGRWGFKGFLASEIPAVSQALGAQVADANLPTSQRVDVARRVVSVDDSAATVQLVLAQINPLVDPALASGLLGAVAESREASTAGAVVGAFPKFSPAARRTAISALLRRAEWSQVLLAAVESRQLQRTDLASEHWNQLKNSRNAEVSAKAKALDATPVASSADMEELIKAMMPAALKTGDAVKGKEIFTTQCAVCHMINGVGGRIGPDLSGIGARAKQDFMVDIIDPNRSVEANYRMWTVTTKSGDTFSGRLDTETATGVEILDTAGQKHAVQRKDITELSASALSIMPAGFGNMPADDFSALLEFIASSRH